MSRGRKEGSVSGKRPIFWNCIGTQDGKIVHEEIWSEEGATQEDLVSFTADVAAASFEEKHGFAPEIVTGPCNYVKGLMKSSPVNSGSVKAKSKENYEIKSVIGAAVYDGWSGLACEIKDSEEVLFIASNRLDGNVGKIIPQSHPIKRELLQFV